MNADMNTMLIQSEILYRAERIRKGVVRRNRIKQIKRAAARTLR